MTDANTEAYTPVTIVGPPTLHCRVQSGSLRSSSSGSEKAVLNLASTNFAGLLGNEKIRDKAVECLRGYGVGSCGPPGFYGNFDTHLILEKSLADFLGVENAILYAQGFSTISSVIPTFAKRADIIVADRGCSFAIQRGIQISRSNVYWYAHNDMDDLERVLKKIEHDLKKSRRPLTRRFIISEGLFEIDGQAADLPRLLELKYAYKYRLILDESWSIGVLGATGRGMTELFDVPVRIRPLVTTSGLTFRVGQRSGCLDRLSRNRAMYIRRLLCGVHGCCPSPSALLPHPHP
jgi:serine palmitoyltransferase